MSKNWFLAIIFSLILVIEVILITQFGLDEINLKILQGSISNNPIITVISPSGGETLTVGTTQYVKWTSSGVDKVTMYLCAELPGMVCSSIPGIPVDGIDAGLGKYQYTVPKVDVFSDNQIAIVKIFDASSNYRIYGQSKKFTMSDGTANTVSDITAKGDITSGLNNIPINKTFSKSGSVYKLQAKPIYSLYVSGERTISKSDGYIRIIFIDSNNKQYLVYEALGPYDSGTSSFDSSCEESCSLNGITPKEIKVEISGAIIKINNIFVAEDKNSVITAKSAQQSSAAKLSKIQDYIRKNNFGWTAGETSVSRMSYEEKRKLLGVAEGKDLPNMQGFEYYKGGVFKIGDSKATSKSGSSKLPSSFDWRNRHGENWLTSIKNQLCGSCWAYGATGAVEAVTNLYYNQHLDLDLSEQEIVSCSGAGSCSGGWPDTALLYYNTAGVVFDSCFEDTGTDAPCNNKCRGSEGKNIVKTGSSGKAIYNNREDDLKKEIIQRGPLSSIVSSWGHAMVLVGWETDPRYNNPVWIFKNSWGKNFGESGYVKIYMPSTDINADLKGTAVGLPIQIELNNQNFQINCVDKDKDNYCNWGISEKKPSTCPSSCKTERDCDDSNANLGSFDSNFKCVSLVNNDNSIEPNISDNIKPKIEYFNFWAPTGKNVNEETSFSINVSDNIGVIGCELNISSLPKQVMKLHCQTKTECSANVNAYKFNKGGKYTAQIECWDMAGNIGKSDKLQIDIAQNCPDCRDSKIDYCKNPPVCSATCGASDPKCIGREQSGWISNGDCNFCYNCEFFTDPANIRQCPQANCTKYGWDNSSCYNFTTNWYPGIILSCTSRSSIGYLKGGKEILCKSGEKVSGGNCIPMLNNKVVESYATKNGWYCKFRCNSLICFVSDGCGAVACSQK